MKGFQSPIFFFAVWIAFSLLPAAFAKDSIPEYFVPPPPFTEGIFPCSVCHGDLKSNSTRRELEFHQEIELKHAEEWRWCLDCHNPNDRDKLRLANGDLIPFEKSYFLCRQCHGTIFRDWRAGLHGKRSGMWNSDEKQYLLCVHCHDPHHPKYQPIKPMPPPKSPEDIQYRSIPEEQIPKNPLNQIEER